MLEAKLVVYVNDDEALCPLQIRTVDESCSQFEQCGECICGECAYGECAYGECAGGLSRQGCIGGPDTPGLTTP